VTTVRICESQSRHLHDRSSQLAHLPGKILPSIASFLPISSAAVLALTCKPILQCLGTRDFHELQRGERQICLRTWRRTKLKRTTIQRERETFLLLLEKDCSHLIFCFFCQILNNLDLDGKQNANNHICVPCCRRVNNEDWYFFSDACHWTRLYTMLKLKRSDLEAKSSPNEYVNKPVLSDYSPPSLQKIHTARLIKGDYYVRKQQWLILPKNAPAQAIETEFNWLVCPHQAFIWGYGSRNIVGMSSTSDSAPTHDARKISAQTLFARTIWCHLRHYSEGTDSKDCATCLGLLQCNLCASEYQVESKHVEGYDVAMVLTSWQNLGEMKNPFCDQWQQFGNKWGGYSMPMPGTVQLFELGSLKAAFESDKTFVFEDAVSQEEMAALKAGSLRSLKIVAAALDDRENCARYSHEELGVPGCNCCAERIPGPLDKYRPTPQRVSSEYLGTPVTTPRVMRLPAGMTYTDRRRFVNSPLHVLRGAVACHENIRRQRIHS
jgi:hypothetical protein